MSSSMQQLKTLRQKTGVSVMACKSALEEAGGDINKAEELLKKKGLSLAEKKSSRATAEGTIDAYIHLGGKIGVLVELRSETDFVAKNEDFKRLAHELCMQVAATNPAYLNREEVPDEVKKRESQSIREQMKGKPEHILEKIIQGKLEKFYGQVCLMDQPFIKDDEKKVSDYIKEHIHKFGENITLARFVRFEVGE